MKAVIIWSGGKDSAYALYKARQQGIDVKYAITGYFRDMLVPPTEETIKAQTAAVGLESIILYSDLITFQIAVEQKLKELIDKENIECVIHGEGHSMSNISWFRDMCKSLKVKPMLPVFTIPAIDLMNELFDNNFKFIITRFLVTSFDDPLVSEYAGKDYTRKIFNEVLSSYPPAEHGLALSSNPFGPSGLLQTFVYDGPIFTKPISVNLEIKQFGRVVLR
jgi:diphthamide synthase (EF-2-diphthine--ammonia ligase)